MATIVYQGTEHCKRIKFCDALNKYGFLDCNEDIVIPAQFDYADDFQQDMALVRIGYKFGWIDMMGKIIIPVKYTDARNFYHGFARVKLGESKRGVWRVIDKQGNIIQDKRILKRLEDVLRG